MCMLVGGFVEVSKTRIFARALGTQQFLVYDMRLTASTEVAMVLPLPVARTAKAFRFIDLSGYPYFFVDLQSCFIEPIASAFAGIAGGAVAARATLPVERVGSFEASFVPSKQDLKRLDPRFRFDDAIWANLPDYEDFGFAVFQLRAAAGRIHPMALSFESTHPHSLFFPTVHVHDGTAPPVADFDHVLYTQDEPQGEGWLVGARLPKERMRLGSLLRSDPTRGIIQPTLPLRRLKLVGSLPNQDTWVTTGLD